MAQMLLLLCIEYRLQNTRITYYINGPTITSSSYLCILYILF